MRGSLLESRRVLVGLVACGLALLLGVAANAASGAPSSGPSVVDAGAVLGPLGISPFFALGGLGLAASLGIYDLPPGLQPFGHPAVVVLLLLLAVGLHIGRSSKLTKPLAEIGGLGESAVGLLATWALAAPFFSGGSGPAQAGFVDGALFILAATSAIAALLVLRTALDVMIWLSPFPFVDAGFQALKLGVTGVLLGAAILLPAVALVLNLLILAATFVFVRWAIRSARFGLTIVYDLTLGRRRVPALPRDPVAEGDLGPFTCFALEAPGLPRRAPAALELRAGRWFLVGAGPGGPRSADTPLGDGDEATVTPTWAGVELSVGEAVVLLPPRYRRLLDELRRETRAELGERARWVPERPRRAAQAQPSTL